MQNKLFKKSSVERFSSPEKLNDYIQVSNPTSWMVLCAMLALLLGVLIWGFFGELTESVSFSGVSGGGRLQCYVSSTVSRELEVGMPVSIRPASDAESVENVPGTIAAIADQPLSYAEASKGIQSDYLLDVLGISTWNVAVEVVPQGELYEDVVYTIVAVTDTQRPIDLVFQ